MGDKHYVRCTECCYQIDLAEASIESQVVNKVVDKNRIIAVRRYLVCPLCFHEHTLFYTDQVVNALLEQGLEEEANKRLDILWEIFENGS